MLAEPLYEFPIRNCFYFYVGIELYFLWYGAHREGLPRRLDAMYSLDWALAISMHPQQLKLKS